MKAMYRKNAMIMSADACTAPAAQSAAMTMTASPRSAMLDTALLAVSFFIGVLRNLSALAVRISLSRQAKP